MVNQRNGMFVIVGEQLGVVVDPSGLDVPQNEVAVWFGRIAPDGSPQVFTVQAAYAIPAKDTPQVYR